MKKTNCQESTWNLIWQTNTTKNSYSSREWRDERADDKIGLFIQNGINFKANEKVLDAGCGDGSILFALKNHFDINIIGVDFSEKALVSAERNSIRKGYPITVLKADTRKLPFESSSLDKIFSLGVIEHLEDPQNAIDELARCLIEDGVLILMTPNKYSFGRIDRLFKKLTGTWKFGHQDEYSIDELSHFTKKSGLTIFKKQVVKRKRFKNDSFAFKLIFIIDSIIGAFISNWGFYSYIYACKKI